MREYPDCPVGAQCRWAASYQAQFHKPAQAAILRRPSCLKGTAAARLRVRIPAKPWKGLVGAQGFEPWTR